MEDDVGADVCEKTAFFRANEIGKVHCTARRCAGRENRSEADHGVTLLGEGDIRKKETSENRCEEG
jgi:hypothetical protein